MQRVIVSNAAELENAVAYYAGQGFLIAHKAERVATLRKPKELNLAVALLASLTCVGLFVYLLVYALKQDQVVEIRVWEPGLGQAGLPPLSEDRRWWWDGQQWRDVEEVAPPNAPRSPDGAWWWDGTAWRAVPEAEWRRDAGS
jgi:hypothetical protein